MIQTKFLEKTIYIKNIQIIIEIIQDNFKLFVAEYKPYIIENIITYNEKNIIVHFI